MAKVQLDKAQKRCDGFSIWVLGMLSAKKKTQEELAYYLNIPQNSLWRRLHGQTAWRLCEYYAVLEFFETEGEQ